MLKTEHICDSCDHQYIVVTLDNHSPPEFCPFCSTPLTVEEELDFGESE